MLSYYTYLTKFTTTTIFANRERGGNGGTRWSPVCVASVISSKMFLNDAILRASDRGQGSF